MGGKITLRLYLEIMKYSSANENSKGADEQVLEVISYYALYFSS